MLSVGRGQWRRTPTIGLCQKELISVRFNPEEWKKEEKKLFGKPILRKAEIERKFAEAVILECSAQNSAWGFGDVDAYDYEGYKRNKRYFLLRDYIEVPENNLTNILIKGGYKSNSYRRYSPLQPCIQMV